MSDKEKLNPIAALQAIPGNIRQFGTEVNPMERPLWEIDNRFVNPFAELPPILTWAKMGGRPAFPLKGIVVISAKPKQGKSFAVYALTRPLLTGKPFESITPLRHANLVMVFDTELSPVSITKRMRKQVEALGENGNRFLSVSLKRIPMQERAALVNAMVEQYHPDIIALDQIANFSPDFNKSGEAVSISEWLKPLSDKALVIVVIHQNKAAEDTNAKGHLGSLVRQDADEYYTVERKNGITTLHCVEARDTDAEGAAAADLLFTINEAGDIITAADILKSNKEKQAEQCRAELREIFGEDDTLTYSEIIKRIMAKWGLTRTPAETKLSRAKECGALIKEEPDNPRSRYRLSMTAAEEFAGVNLAALDD